MIYALFYCALIPHTLDCRPDVQPFFGGFYKTEAECLTMEAFYNKRTTSSFRYFCAAKPTFVPID